MWDVLGLEPTTDQAAVRRAYVARLKAIDIDHDPAAFIRLREAYEQCLRWEGLQEEADDEDWDKLDFDGPSLTPLLDREPEPAELAPHSSQPPLVDPGTTTQTADAERGFASVEAFDAAWSRAVIRGQFRPMAALYLEGLVAGLIPLGQEREAHAAVVQMGAENLQIPFAEVRRFAEAHAWEPSREVWRRRADDFGEIYAARRAAEDWLDEQIRLSQPPFNWIGLAKWLFNWSWLGPSPTRAARAVLGRTGAWRLREDDARIVQTSLEALRRHAPYLGDRLNAQKTAQLQRRVEFLTRKGFVIGTWRFVRWLFVLAVKLNFALGLFVAAELLLLWIFQSHH